jgi:hypothetical protein
MELYSCFSSVPEWREWGHLCVISGFCREVDENCALLDYYAAGSGNFLPTFWDNLLVPSSRFMNPFGCPETSVGNYHYSLRNDTEKRSSQGQLCLLPSTRRMFLFREFISSYTGALRRLFFWRSED